MLQQIDDMETRKDLERQIRTKLQGLRNRIESGDESQLLVWLIRDILACSQRPLRDHPRFGGRKHGHTPLPPEAKPLVIEWVRRIKDEEGIRSIISLLEGRQLDRYYVRGGRDLHERGLLGYYISQGLELRCFPMTDYQRPPESAMRKVLQAFDELPKPVLLHCSAAIDRTAPVAAFIVQQRRK